MTPSCCVCSLQHKKAKLERAPPAGLVLPDAADLDLLAAHVLWARAVVIANLIRKGYPVPNWERHLEHLLEHALEAASVDGSSIVGLETAVKDDLSHLCNGGMPLFAFVHALALSSSATAVNAELSNWCMRTKTSEQGNMGKGLLAGIVALGSSVMATKPRDHKKRSDEVSDAAPGTIVDQQRGALGPAPGFAEQPEGLFGMSQSTVLADQHVETRVVGAILPEFIAHAFGTKK